MVAAFLVVAVFVVFGRTLGHDFVNYDDHEYVTENVHVARGLDGDCFQWAFTSRQCSNWHPITWLSHALDCQLFGLSPWGHHLTNVLLHAATSVLLFMVLRRMTGDFWPSALVAAVFAIHPLRVESVAWIAERKDVLSGLFFVLTLGTYERYVRRRSPAWYSAVVVLFALGLMAKPMLVTLPFVLLLLDYWPLERKDTKRLLVEKLPLLAMAAASSAATLWAQRNAMQTIEHLSLSCRLENATVAYVGYIGQLFYPADLAVFYPHPGRSLPEWKIVASLVVLAAISAGIVSLRRRAPYLAVGWLWFLGMLLPVIGLVQVGAQSMADRYTYLPQIGLCIAMAWAAARLVRERRWNATAVAAVSALVLAILMGRAYEQASYWRDSETLWTHALTCTPPNAIAHCNLGSALVDRGKLQEGIEEYKKALAIDPKSVLAHSNLGMALTDVGQFKEAVEQLDAALSLDPEHADAHYNLGETLRRMGRLSDAIGHLRKSLTLKPDRADARTSLGAALGQQGHAAEAMEQLEIALKLDPRRAEAHNDLGITLAGLKRFDEAIEHYRAALTSKPDYAEAHNNLGFALASQGKLDEAIQEYRLALRCRPDYARAEQNLAEALRRKAASKP